MNSLVEVIFRGVFSSVKLNFLKDLMIGARELYFIEPEDSPVGAFDEVAEIINANVYIDFVINTNELRIYEKTVPRVFINLGRNNDDIEVLFFFDLRDMGEPAAKKNIDMLKKWTMEFKHEYKFDYFICQADNADKEEYYFDSYGIGQLYRRFNS